MASTAKRRCKGKTKKGRRCQAPPLREGEYCRAHDPLLPADARFGSPEQAAAAGALGGAAGRRPRIVERLLERIDEDIDHILGAYFEALDAERAVVVGSGEEAYLEQVPDHKRRIEGANAILDRGYGKPRQVTELAGEGGGPVRVEDAFADPETRKALHELVRRVGAARAGEPGRPGAGD